MSEKSAVTRAAAVICAAAAVISVMKLSPSEGKAPVNALFAPFAPSPRPVTSAEYSANEEDGADNAADTESESDKDKEDNGVPEQTGTPDLPQLPETDKDNMISPEGSSEDTDSDSQIRHEETGTDSGGSSGESDESSTLDSIPETTDSSSPDSSTSPEADTQSMIDNTATTSKPAASSDSSSVPDESAAEQITADGTPADEAGKETVPDGGTIESLFDTDITDGAHYSDPYLGFTINYTHPELTLMQTEVRLNGESQPFSESVYLSSENGGVNRIYIAVTCADEKGQVYSAYREYTVTLDPPPQESSSEEDKIPPVFVTDLTDSVRQEEGFAFKAYIDGDAEDPHLTVTLNGKPLAGSSGSFICTLAEGANTITVSGGYDFGGEHTAINYSYTITLTPKKKAPELEYHNVPDETKSSKYTLDLLAKDCDGKRINGGGINVRLNGTKLPNKWNGEYTCYLLELKPGENTLDIRVTDSRGEFTDYAFTIVCTSNGDGEVIGRAYLSADCNVLGLGQLLGQTDIDIVQGESAARAIVKALESNGFSVGYTGDLDSGCYIYGIYKEGMSAGAEIPAALLECIEADPGVSVTAPAGPDGLRDHDFTSGSGWMVTVNGHFTSYGFSDIHMQDGDSVKIRYTLAVGKDIGDAGGGSCYSVQY